MIYVYKLWDFWNGYWIDDTEENRNKIDDSDNKYWMDIDGYQQYKLLVPPSGNISNMRIF